MIKNWAVRQSITDIGTESIKLEWTETFLLKRLKKKKFEEASVNRKHIGNITQCKKPLIPTRPQIILIKALTEVRRVKKCFDRAVDDTFLLVKTE